MNTEINSLKENKKKQDNSKEIKVKPEILTCRGILGETSRTLFNRERERLERIEKRTRTIVMSMAQHIVDIMSRVVYAIVLR